VKQVKIKLKAAAYTHKGMDFAKLFSYYDRDNSGSLEFPEFVSAIRRDAKISPAEVSDEALQEVFDAVDDDGGGEVDIDEFVAWLNSKTSGLVVKKKKKKKRRVVKRKKVRVARVWIVCVVFMFVFVLFCLVLFCFVLFCFVLFCCLAASITQPTASAQGRDVLGSDQLWVQLPRRWRRAWSWRSCHTTGGAAEPGRGDDSPRQVEAACRLLHHGRRQLRQAVPALRP